MGAVFGIVATLALTEPSGRLEFLGHTRELLTSPKSVLN